MFDTGISEIAHIVAQVILVLLLMTSVLSTAAFLNRRSFFRRRFLPRPSKVIDELMRSESRDAVLAVLQGNTSRECAIVLRGLEPEAKDEKRFRERVHCLVAAERPRWSRFQLVFAWLSSSAPMAGLLGTILGLMKSFTDIAVSNSAEPKVALGGIADALVTTVLGILVAVPAAAFYNYCRQRVRQAGEDIEAIATAVVASGALDR